MEIISELMAARRNQRLHGFSGNAGEEKAVPCVSEDLID